MYELRSYYSFWGEPDSIRTSVFTSIWDAYWSYHRADHIDTSHKIFYTKGGNEVEIRIGTLEKQLMKRGRCNDK